MRKSCTYPYSRLAVKLFPLMVGLLAIIFFSMRLIPSFEWNSWTLQFMWHALGTTHAHQIPSTIPDGHARAKIWLAQNAIASGDPLQALAMIEPLVIQGDPFAVRLQATALEQHKDFGDALQVLVKLQDSNLLIAFGNNMVRAKDQADALAAFKAAWSIDHEMGSLALANYLANQNGDLAGAATVLRNALASYPLSSQRLFWYRSLGDNLRRQKRYDEAEAMYKSAFLENPNDQVLYIGRANNARLAGNLELALTVYRGATRLFPDYAVVYYEMAWAYRLNDQPDEAQASIEKALALNNSPNESYYVRAGQIYEWRGEIDEALEAYRNALAINPDSDNAKKGISRLSGL